MTEPGHYLDEKDKFHDKWCTFTIKRALFSFNFEVSRIESLLNYTVEDVLSCRMTNSL